MLRRTKDQTIDGKPLIQLPDKTVTIVECEFDDEEKEFYEMVEKKMNKNLDAMMKTMDAAGKNKNVVSMLILLLRMRQGEL